ncbi:MAG: 6-phosphogluconate dehydrogenase, decarboxylating [Clostridiales bacterium 38_11]|nr:MAG: 6-phosphogluconate dehydrogenase, decarboxylating [Clostridiales bacterium 38_11]HBH11574.1 decarboxylating 6-phosphogluconate dehydrogenase [Clostridiales bacterium]
MKIGIIGLGKMGYNLALNMRDKGYDVQAYNRSNAKVDAIIQEGVTGHYTIASLMGALDDRKVVWLMVPAGEAVDSVIEELSPCLKAGDIVIDGGNSKYQDTINRNNSLNENGVYYLDAGTSGGTEGARNGACMMVGGDVKAVEYLEDFFKALTVENGFLHTGISGSGHYVKMIHNGIEYGMMQAIGEGFNILKSSRFNLDYSAIAKVWSNGSIIRGLLMNLTEQAFINNGNLENIIPIIDAHGEGQWTVEEAIRLNVPIPVIANSLFVRYASKDSGQFSDKVVAALRNEFGGHKLHVQ